MSIGSFDDILGPDEDELEFEIEEFEELTEEELEELFQETLNESLRNLKRRNGKKVWLPEREMNG